VHLKDGSLTTILSAFCKLLPEILADFIQKVLTGIGEYAMALKKKPFSCDHCGNEEEFIWKTRHGKETKILTIYQWVTLRQLQVRCNRCGHKFYITRKLLGIEPMKRIPADTYRRLGLMGSLTTFRVAEKIVKMFGWSVDKMTVWKSVQKTAEELEFKLDPGELPHGEADGTGISINGIKKRGKELKVFVQYKKGGGVRVAGIDIGNYNSDWKRLFKDSIEVLKGFRKFLLVTDGDTSIFEDLKEKVEILIQRCLWHIPYQLKYTLWKDKVKRKTDNWLHLLSEVLEICAIRPMVDCEETIKAMIASKQKRLDEIIEYCKARGYEHSVAYLENARGDMFTAINNRLHGRTTSRVERLFRTVNMRINVGKWSMTGGLNVTKVRLAYYYNGFDA
jgi:DNA-directed RNA polymerase subunit RPC12/RpoP